MILAGALRFTALFLFYAMMIFVVICIGFLVSEYIKERRRNAQIQRLARSIENDKLVRKAVFDTIEKGAENLNAKNNKD